jgi:conjugative relaxase-like TrwC/TraI family protein
MLRITQQTDSAAAKSYYSKSDYYSEGQEIIGFWGGKVAERLRLEGIVDKARFDQLCDNINPTNGKSLTLRTKSERTVGYDFTFSVPKSVSLIYARTGSCDILKAFRSSIDETMREIEAEMKARVRIGGRDEERVSGSMLWAEYIHTTARPIDKIPDPHLHGHIFAFNVTYDEKERRLKAGQFRDLKRDAPYFQSAFRVRLANKLQELGFEIVRKRDDFEIAGISASLIRKFSRRTDEIERIAEERGITDPNRKGELGRETRENKSSELTLDELEKIWDGWLTDAERKALGAASKPGSPIRPVQEDRRAVDHAIEHCFIREATVPERQLLTEALKRGLGSVTIEAVKKELAARPLIRGDYRGRPTATTTELRDCDQTLISWSRKGRGKYRPIAPTSRTIVRDFLNVGQRKAVRHVLNSRDFITGVRGVAGTGKTTGVEAELRDAFAEAGISVAALAQSTTAVDELRTAAGFEGAVTIARFLKDEKLQNDIAGGVMLIDEGSLIGSRQMLKLAEIAQRQRARMVLVGDILQHRSVLAGEPMRLLQERGGMRVAEVTEIMRQEHKDYLKAAEFLSKGDTKQGFETLDRLGWIREIPHAGRYWVLAQGYLSTILEKKKNGETKSALVVAPTHAEIARVTKFIRDAQKTDGKLKNERIIDTWVSARLTDPEKTDATQYSPGDMLQFHENAPGHVKGSQLLVEEKTKLPLDKSDRFELYRPRKLALAVNDRVRVTVNGKTLDGKHVLKNGALFTVQGFTKRGQPIVDHGWVIANGHLDYGYAVTSHASEGRTVDKEFVAISSQSYGATNQRSFYVPVTRGREQCVVFTDSKAELLKAASRPDTPPSALEFAEANSPARVFQRRLHKHLELVRRTLNFGRRRASINHIRAHEREKGYAYER